MTGEPFERDFLPPPDPPRPKRPRRLRRSKPTVSILHRHIPTYYLLPLLLPYGGHVAFAEGVWPLRFRYWAERQAARFLSQLLRT